jgi:hypothetical protein
VPDRGHSTKKVSKPLPRLSSPFLLSFHFLPSLFSATHPTRRRPTAARPTRPVRRRRRPASPRARHAAPGRTPPAPTRPAKPPPAAPTPLPARRRPSAPHAFGRAPSQGLLNLFNLCVFIFILYCHMLFNLLNLCVFIVILCVLLNLYYMFIEFSEFILRVYIMCL